MVQVLDPLYSRALSELQKKWVH